MKEKKSTLGVILLNHMYRKIVVFKLHIHPRHRYPKSYLHSTLAHFNYLKQHHVFHTILLVMSIHPIRTTRFPSSVSTFPLLCWSLFSFFTGLQSQTHIRSFNCLLCSNLKKTNPNHYSYHDNYTQGFLSSGTI